MLHIVMARGELGQTVLGLGEQAGGVVSGSLGIAVSPRVLEAPGTEILRILSSVGSGNVPEMISTTASVPFDLIQILVKAGAPGLAAIVLASFGVFMIGKGAVDRHVARRI